MFHSICRQPEGTIDVPGKFNPISYQQSLAGRPINDVKQEVRRALVSSKPCRVVVFAGELEVRLLGLGPDLCDLVDIQVAFDSVGKRERTRKIKTLPPLLPNHNHYSLKGLSEAILGFKIQASAHCALEDAAATMALYNWGKDWILPELVST